MVKGKNHKKYLEKKKLEMQKKEKEKETTDLFNKNTRDNTNEKISFDFKIPGFLNDKYKKEKNQDNDANISNFNYILKPVKDISSELNINEQNDNSNFLALNNSESRMNTFPKIYYNLFERQNPNLNNETELNLDDKMILDDNGDYKFSSGRLKSLFDYDDEKDVYKNSNDKVNFLETEMKDKDFSNIIDDNNMFDINNYNYNNSNDIDKYISNKDNNNDIDKYISNNDNNKVIDNYISNNDNNSDNNINDNSNDTNKDNNIKNTNKLKFNIKFYQKNKEFFMDIITNEPPFTSPEFYSMNRQGNLRILWEGNNRIFNDIFELRNRTGVIYVDLYNFLAYNSRHRNEKERKFDSDNMAEKIKTYLNKMMYEPFNTVFKDKIKINFQTKNSTNNPKNDFNCPFLKIKLRCILSNDPSNLKAINNIDSNNSENKELIKYLDSTPEYCLDYFLFNKQGNEGMFNGKNVVDFLFGEIDRLGKSKKNIQDNEILKDYIAALLLLSYNLKRLFFLKRARKFKKNYSHLFKIIKKEKNN